MNYAYLNSEIVAFSDALIPVSDLSIQRAYAVFDYFKVLNKQCYHIDDHLARFKNSAELSYLKLPLSFEEIKRICNTLIDMSDLKKPALKLILTASTAESAKDNLIILSEELPTYTSKLYSKGIRLFTEAYQREMPSVKSTNYMNFFRLKRKLQLQANQDILYYNRSSITECPRSNFFAVKKNKVITSKDNILEGITRKSILTLIKGKYPCEIRNIPINEITEFDEAFVTSTTRGIMPVSEIDGIKISKGKIGPLTSDLRQLLDNEMENYS